MLLSRYPNKCSSFQNASIHTILNDGASASQVVLGIGAYGKTFNLSSPTTDNSTGAAITGAGVAGVYSQEAGTWSYLEARNFHIYLISDIILIC